MKTLRWVAAGVIVSVLSFGSGTSHAQDDIPFDSAIDVQLFEYAIGPRSFLTVPNAGVAYPGQISADFLVTYLTSPFTIYNLDSMDGNIVDERSEVISTLIAGELNAAYGLTSKLQLGIALPLVFRIAGDGVDPGTAQPDDMSGISASGLGDMRIEAKYLVWSNDSLSVAAAGGLSVPTSFGLGGSDFLGDDLPYGRANALVQWSSGKISAGAKLGVIVGKKRSIYSSDVGQQITFGGAGAYQITERFGAVAEVFGRAGFDLSGNSMPLEAAGAARIKATTDLSVLAGGGAGLLNGIGSPKVRVFVSVGWAPDTRDDDKDGLANVDDKCPLLPEDKDGHEDSDGCPDDDNDGDRREDAVDQCPNKKEDIDGFEDEDGCPELDNDNDGLIDTKDRCPNEPEDGLSLGELAKDGCPGSKTDSDFDEVMDDMDRCMDKEEDKDGFNDWDGCPEADNDNDGIEDEADKCPVCAEDKDGFQDDDGCPDIDNDGDGIPDTQDQCPMEAEVINGKDDEDGCPDRGRSRGGKLAKLEGDRIVLDKEIKFRKTRLRSRSKKVVQAVAEVMKAHPEVTEWLVFVAPPRGRDEEKAKADGEKMARVLKANLIINGVEGSRITTRGMASDKLAIGIRALNREDGGNSGAFVCPAPFKAQETEPSAKPVPATTAPASVPDAAKKDAAKPDAAKKDGIAPKPANPEK